MKKERLRLLPLLLLLSLFVHAQQPVVITGTVTNGKTGEALEGVTIRVDNLKSGNMTRADGSYSITVNTDSRSLSFSFVGYNKQPAEIKGRSRIDISLAPDNSSFNDAVVIGYGTQRKRDLTGSVVSIAAKDLGETPITRPDQMIQGRSSGVQVTQTNSAPGGNISIRIRGTNSINSFFVRIFICWGWPIIFPVRRNMRGRRASWWRYGFWTRLRG